MTATLDDEDGSLTLDASNLLGGTLLMLQWLVSHLAVTLRTGEADVLVRLRAFLDEQA